MARTRDAYIRMRAEHSEKAALMEIAADRGLTLTELLIEPHRDEIQHRHELQTVGN
jgi:hypothetical protein